MCGQLADGASELRIPYGPGFRIYYVQRGCEVVVSSRAATRALNIQDIARAIELARTV